MSPKPSAATNEATRREWRLLGFHYHRDHGLRRWLITASRAGLRKLCELLRAYAADPRNTAISEHEHLGPYSYLELMTWPDALIDHHAICGAPKDFERLATLIEETTAGLTPGSAIELAKAYAPASPYELRLELREDSFDPASADPQLSEG